MNECGYCGGYTKENFCHPECEANWKTDRLKERSPNGDPNLRDVVRDIYHERGQLIVVDFKVKTWKRIA